MELEILHLIQGIRTGWLDVIMVFLTTLGDEGIIWIALSVVLVMIPKTRRCGLAIATSMILSHIVGNEILKPLLARPRPFMEDPSVQLIVEAPTSYSFPSGHTMNGFTAACTLWAFYRKPGIAALVLAALIAFSRMYLFLHYPTDILGGIALAVVDTWIVVKMMKRIKLRFQKAA